MSHVQTDPDGTRRVVIWKSDSAENSHDERISMRMMTPAEIEDGQAKLAPLLGDAHDLLTKLRRDPHASPDALSRVEAHYRDLSSLYHRLDELRGVAAAHARVQRIAGLDGDEGGDTRTVLAKAAGDSYAEQGAAVEQVASRLEKSEGLSPTAAYSRALRECGVDTRAAA
jgi:hypothetical protein